MKIECALLAAVMLAGCSPAPAPVAAAPPPAMPTREEIIARGKYIVDGVGLCGDCHTPLGGHATFEADSQRVRFEGMVASPDGKQMIRSASERYVPAGGQLREHALTLARETADRLLEQGAAEIMSSAEKARDPRIKPS